MMPFQSIVGEICSSGDELTAKVRKPYTITKQRERWTEEEHLKFLEALKLYGRAWRRIEEHIGTKTAVQIRSHAQKFFSKLVRGSSGRGVSSTEKSHDIEIPPPRPKRKPRHPYPRKAGGNQATAKEGSTSPSAISSATTLTLRDKPSEHAGFAPYDARRTLNGYETKMELPQRKGSPLSLKLFGQTMMVTGAERPTISASKPSVSGHSQGDFHEFVSAKEEITSVKIKSEDKALENGGEGLHALGLGLHTKQATNSAVHSESVIDSATPSEQKTNMLLCDTLSSAARDSRGKQDSEIQASSGQGSNSSSLPSDQELPGTLPGCPRHTAMQCVVDGMSRENGHEAVKNWLGIAPSGYPTSAMGVASDSALVPQLPPMFPWIQIQQGNTTAADAVAAATVAAASAWLSLCGAVPSFLHPGFFGTATPAANDLSACKAESMMGAMEQEGSIMVEREGEVMLQGSHSEKCTCNVMKEFDDSQDHGENISCQTEEQDQVVEDTELSNERSSSCSNNRLNNDQEFDPHSGTNIEESREVCQQGFQLYGGRCASEEEDSSKEEEDAASNNGGGQCTEVQREGQYACGTFSQEFLPHSFSMPSSVGGGLSLDMNNKDSFPEDGKHDTSRIGGGKMRPDLRGSICCEGKPYAGERNEQTPPKSPCAYREKKLEDSKPTMGHQLLEEPVAKFCKSNKFIASSIGKSQSGAGFVPYQRCSIQASKNRLHSRSADSSDVEREEKRICSKQ